MSAGEHAKYNPDTRSPPSSISTAGPVSPHYTSTPEQPLPSLAGCLGTYSSFTPSAVPGVWLCVHRLHPSSCATCWGIFLVPFLMYTKLSTFPFSHPLVFTPFCSCSEIQLLRRQVEGGYLPKSKLTVALPPLQTPDSPALLIRLNCFPLTNITSCCCFFFFF